MARQELEADGGIEKDAHRKDRKTDDGILEEAEASKFCLLQRTLGDHVTGRTDEGEVSAHGCGEYQRHQKTGSLVAGLCCDADHHRDQNGSGSCIGKDTAHQSDNHHDGDDELTLCFRKLCHNAADLIGHAGLEKGTAHDKHGNKEDNVGINKTGKSGFHIQYLGDHQADADDHGCQSQRDLFCHEHDDRKCEK